MKLESNLPFGWRAVCRTSPISMMNPPYFASSASALTHDTAALLRSHPTAATSLLPLLQRERSPTARQRKDDAPSVVDPRSDIKTSKFFCCRQIHHSSDGPMSCHSTPPRPQDSAPRHSATALARSRNHNDSSSSRAASGAAGCLPIIPICHRRGTHNQLEPTINSLTPKLDEPGRMMCGTIAAHHPPGGIWTVGRNHEIAALQYRGFGPGVQQR